MSVLKQKGVEEKRVGGMRILIDTRRQCALLLLGCIYARVEYLLIKCGRIALQICGAGSRKLLSQQDVRRIAEVKRACLDDN